ncbi:probable E3 ubiquitin-protein ligase MARCHF10 isoform X2 [Rhinolophus ferrumequinum]|uniref:probable E3 ubiquitin-protein ligase MARCHF10 isoform X2 n=1 Tax=Rhinolophus ferrumequinum TaxID=59479 RepID=UPI00140FC962|nr:probable E3 ubiquitin-protein ligase MARCHF10 isoform X2 [Rhinolophus ferrumequinum]
MLHEARDRQKFVSEVLYLRHMQHKVDSEYQACLRQQEYRKDPNEKKRDQSGGQETNFERSRFSSGSSSKQPNSTYCCLVLPLVPPATPVAQDSSSHLPPASLPSFMRPTASSLDPGPESPAALCYFPVSCPTQGETPVLCLPGPRRPSRIYLLW